MTRRTIIWLIVGTVGVVTAAFASLIALPTGILFFLRRRLPQAIEEPASVFRIGPPADFAVGVDTRFLQSHRVCVVRNASRLYVIYARCPHKGCTPDWIASDAKFKCPCHESRFCMGSAFAGNGINCEGPAPRPLDRAHIEVDERGNVVADLSKLYQWPKGSPSQFDDPGAYVSLQT
ncbi:MAG TPA: Rieske (2Fe-2S) protein [Pyrinomonadaceae bacterium]|nr:Rieske (2Fe-2S) protein [Pyrinomonadaceae bacterium]